MPVGDIFSAAVLLLLVIDPFGNVPIVVSALGSGAPGRRARIVLRECLAAYLILGGIFVLAGAFVWTLRSPRSEDANA